MIDRGSTVQFKAPFSSIFGMGALAFKLAEESEVPRTHKPLSEEDLLWLGNIWLCWNVWSWRTWEEKSDIKANFPCEMCRFTQSCSHWKKLYQCFHENSHFQSMLTLDLFLPVLLPGDYNTVSFVLLCFFISKFFLICAPQMRAETFRGEIFWN